MVFRKILTNLLLSLLSSALLALSFPKTNFFWLAWLALVPLLAVLERSTRRAAFGQAYLCGLAFFLVTLQWIHYVTALGLVLLCAYLALYFGLFGLAVHRFRDRPFAERLFLVPAVWCILEFVRDRLLTGFGWGALGHSQAPNILLIQIADITGVAGVSFLVAAFNVIVWEALRSSDVGGRMPDGSSDRRLQTSDGFVGKPFFRSALLYCLLLVAALAYGAWRLSLPADGHQTRVALIQGNIPLADFWDPQIRADIVHHYLKLSRATLAQKPDLIIWPETSFPNFFWELPEYFEEVKAFARQNNVSLLIGAVTKGGDKYFNSAFLITAQDEIKQAYHKRHLVVFGEYIPFRKAFPFLASIVPIDDFSAGPSGTVFRLPSGERFSVLICFEDTLSQLARRDVDNGADFLVNMTNDAWFGDSAQPRMHLQNAEFRAVENNRELVRATNTGETCRVTSAGHIGPCVGDETGKRVLTEGVIVTSVFLHRGKTFYTKHGDVFTFLLFLGILGLFIKPFQGGNLLWMLGRTGKRS
jgi:apolipoprotein N-acyltransferase